MNTPVMTSVETPSSAPLGAIMIVGGGISGMQSALDLANAGFKVYLIEQSPAIGGKMAQLDKTFPTNDCSMCIVSPKLVEVGRHKNIELLTHSEVSKLEGQAGRFTATITRHARFVDLEKCTGCGACEIACPVTQLSYFPPLPAEGEKRKFAKAKEKRLITGPGMPQARSVLAWTFSVHKEKCGKCGLCQRACLQSAISWEKGEIAAIDAQACTGCGACYMACPEKFSAIEISDAPELDKSIGAALVFRSQEIKKELRNEQGRDCIRCGLCALMCREVMGINALSMVNEGIEAGTDICQVCGACVSVCPVNFLSLDQVGSRASRPLLNTFNEGLDGRKPVNIHYPQAVPRVPVIDPESCVRLNSGACGTCATVCGVNAIDYEHKTSQAEIHIGSVIFSPGFEVFDASIRGEFGYGIYKNVVTSIEFERLLSASGPTSGTVARPGDGRHPKKIAWIQCVGSRDHSCNRDYCSSVCCMYATKEAYIAREHDKSIEPTIFYIDMRSFGKNFDDYITRAKDNKVRFVRAMVSKVFEDPQTGDLELRYVDDAGNRQIETFDLVVLSVGMQIAEETKELAGRLGVDMDGFGFAKTSSFSPLATSKPGVFVSGAFNGPKDIPETVSEASGAALAASSGLAVARSTLIAEEILPEEREINPEDELRIGVFICHCGMNIASVVDVEAVMKYAATLPGVVYVDHPLYTCSQDTQERFRDIIQEHRLNRVVVSACSPSTHEPLFMSTLRQAGINKYFFDMANIRDQCSWVHPLEPAKATEKAKRLTRMAIANASQARPLHEMEFSVDQRLLVIGGGIAGMIAALEGARQGFRVVLVEKDANLGGHLNRLKRTVEGEPVVDFLHDLQARIAGEERIRVHTSSVVIDHAGFIGNFETEIMTPTGTPRSIKHGAIILATGGEEHRPQLFALDEMDTVMTQTDFESLLESPPETAETLTGIVMLQCAGSRDEQHLNYCSRVCCNQAVKNALAAKKRYPHMRIDILYRDMRCYGLGELHYRQARLAGINFIRYDTESNQPNIDVTDHGVFVRLIDPSVQAEVRIKADRLILSTGIRPRDTEELSSMLRCTRNQHGFFIEAHAKLRPVDLPSEGLFMAGTAHGPKNIPETISQAQAAVARAATILSQKHLTMSAVVSRVDPTNCAVCLTCVRACPYGIPFINADHTAEINPALCQGCGICVAECPAKTIHLGRYDDRNIFAKIASNLEIEAPEPERVQ